MFISDWSLMATLLFKWQPSLISICEYEELNRNIRIPKSSHIDKTFGAICFALSSERIYAIDQAVNNFGCMFRMPLRCHREWKSISPESQRAYVQHAAGAFRWNVHHGQVRLSVRGTISGQICIVSMTINGLLIMPLGSHTIDNTDTFCFESISINISIWANEHCCCSMLNILLFTVCLYISESVSQSRIVSSNSNWAKLARQTRQDKTRQDKTKHQLLN